MDINVLKKYAMLIAKSGVNVQKGQYVIINAEIDQAEFVSLVVDACYECGAKHVEVDWNQVAKIRISQVKNETVEQLAEIPNWVLEKMKFYCEENPCRIHIVSASPNKMAGLDQAKSSKARMMSYPLLKEYYDKMDGQYQWTIAAIPSTEWAKEVFPTLDEEEAINKLWDAILHTTRITDDPIKEWEKHNADLLERCNYLNNLDIDYLHYETSNGTNLKVWLMKQGMWLGGGDTSLRGVYYFPNMPTEECFTTPIKGKAEGKVVSSKPLSYNGELIEDFSFTFKDGKVDSFTAKRGEHLIKQMLEMDENAVYLGECALVPFESPVNETGILFLNTLFDENAVCHFALGRGFNECVRNHENLTKKDFDEFGVNDSMIHVDFMIGTRDLSVKAILRDGKEVQIFKNGTWAF